MSAAMAPSHVSEDCECRRVLGLFACLRDKRLDVWGILHQTFAHCVPNQSRHFRNAKFSHDVGSVRIRGLVADP